MEIQEETHYSNENDDDYRNMNWSPVDEQISWLKKQVKILSLSLKELEDLNESTQSLYFVESVLYQCNQRIKQLKEKEQ